MRLHHYFFAHRVLYEEFTLTGGLLGILARPEGQRHLVELWNSVPNDPDWDARCRETFERMTGDEDILAEVGGSEGQEPSDGLDYWSQHLSSNGLESAAYWLGDRHLVFLVTLPKPERGTEAHFVALICSPILEYLLLEKISSALDAAATFFCRREPEKHVNLGRGTAPDRNEFLRHICRHLNVPEIIENADIRDLHPSEESGTRGTCAPSADIASGRLDDRQVEEWVRNAESALADGDLLRAGTLTMYLVEHRDAHLGPRRRQSTRVVQPLIDAYCARGSLTEAMAFSYSWFRVCARHRPLGDPETMLAMRYLADAYLRKGLITEGSAMMRQRTNLAKAVFGCGSKEFYAAEQEDFRWVGAALQMDPPSAP